MMLAALPPTGYYRMAELKGQVDRVIQQALNMKFELARQPAMMEDGVGRMVNLLA